MGCNSPLALNKSFQSGCQFFLGSLFYLAQSAGEKALI